jgi:hypothetical protein
MAQRAVNGLFRFAVVAAVLTALGGGLSIYRSAQNRGPMIQANVTLRGCASDTKGARWEIIATNESDIPFTISKITLRVDGKAYNSITRIPRHASGSFGFLVVGPGKVKHLDAVSNPGFVHIMYSAGQPGFDNDRGIRISGDCKATGDA